MLILSGGVMFFGDTMPPKKAAGIAAAMGGIIWCASLSVCLCLSWPLLLLLPLQVVLPPVKPLDSPFRSPFNLL